MRKFTGFIKNTTRQLTILTGIIGLTFTAGLEWAEAAETSARSAGGMPGELHVVFLFLLMFGVLAVMVVKPQQRSRVRGRPEKQRTARR
ncbi:MAG: hypothetical protein O3C49_09480 [Proteobacteria bacterium]|nr:hypothetical protein [Pseudomonadota bacterium]